MLFFLVSNTAIIGCCFRQYHSFVQILIFCKGIASANPLGMAQLLDSRQLNTPFLPQELVSLEWGFLRCLDHGRHWTELFSPKNIQRPCFQQ